MSVDVFSDSDIKAKENLQQRHRWGKLWQGVFFLSTFIGVVMLVLLLLSIINQSFGYVVWTYKVPPQSLSEKAIDELRSEELVDIIRKNIRPLRLRTIEKEKPLDSRTQEELVNLVMEKVVEPKVLKTYSLYDSLFFRKEIEAEAKEEYQEGILTFHAWLNDKFLERSMSSQAQLAGVRSALKG